MNQGAPSSTPPFTVLPGGRRVAGTVAGVHTVIARAEDRPFSVDGEVLEEDTWLTLSTKVSALRDPGHPVRVMTRVWEATPEKPGTVVVRSGPPVRLLAIVHDLDAEPICSEDWIAAALDQVFRLCDQQRLRSLKVPAIGARHAGIEPVRFTALLGQALRRAAQRHAGSSLRRLWLVRGPDSGEDMLQALVAHG